MNLTNSDIGLHEEVRKALADAVPGIAGEIAEGFTLKRACQLYLMHTRLEKKHEIASKALKSVLLGLLEKVDSGVRVSGTSRYVVEEYELCRKIPKKISYDETKLMELYAKHPEIREAFKPELRPVEKAVKALTGVAALEINSIRTESCGSPSLEVEPLRGASDPVLTAIESPDYGVDAL